MDRVDTTAVLSPAVPALECSGLVAGYHQVRVLDGLDLSIGQGEMVGLLGPNGAGKTTLLRAVTGICPTLGGTLRLFGADTATLSAGARARQVAVVPQELETPMAFTIEEIVMMGRTASLSRWKRPGPGDLDIVEQAMAYTDVVPMRERPFTELSGGEKQRAVIAMALAQEPSLMLLDEPTSHLDLNHRIEIMGIVDRLNRERDVTVIMASHDLNLAAEYCTRIVLLHEGGIVADGTPGEVLTEETLKQVYRCDVRVRRDPEYGTVTVTPPPRRSRSVA